MSPAKKTGQKKGSLGWLEAIYHADPLAAKAKFEELYPAAGETHYKLQKPGEGQSVSRTDVDREDGITYESYSPPAIWEVPYQVLRLTLEKKARPEKFIFHSGEELLTPISGSIRYHFFWRDPKRKGKATPVAPAVDELKPLKPGSIIRINPELPHHAWSVAAGESTAWMIIRHLSNTGPSLTLDKLETEDIHPTARRVKATDLKDPGRLALISWGLSEKIKLQRDRSNLKIAQVAAYCGIDASHLSRIENADTNVTLDTLLRIGKFLQIDLDRLIAPEPWGYEIAPLTRKRPKEPEELLEPPPKPRRPTQPGHFLHPRHWHLRAGQHVDEPRPKELKAETTKWNHPSSWIVLQGRVIVDIDTAAGTNSELAVRDSVIHLREDAPRKIQAIEDSSLLQIVFSGECYCKDPKQ